MITFSTYNGSTYNCISGYFTDSFGTIFAERDAQAYIVLYAHARKIIKKNHLNHITPSPFSSEQAMKLFKRSITRTRGNSKSETLQHHKIILQSGSIAMQCVAITLQCDKFNILSTN
jgi:hypothetical protein